jgi:Bax protein
MALKPHPRSITIAQAAMESAWATSRFFKEANNIFGVWSFNEDEPRIAALKKRGNKTIWVKKYSSVTASVRDYYYVMGRSVAFQEFRKLKMVTDDPLLLVKKLDRYSEKGAEYGHELTSMITFNKFYHYDK